MRDRGGDSRLHLGRMREFGRIPAWEPRNFWDRDTAWEMSLSTEINLDGAYCSSWDEVWI